VKPSVAFVDTLFIILAVLMLLPMKPDMARDDEARAGMVVVEAHWQDAARTDVDLWVQSPADRPVGYSRLRGNYFSLFRDDLGSDTTPWRYEIAATRAIPDGEYIVTLHAYTDAGINLPMNVDVVVWYRNADGAKIHIWRGLVPLTYVTQEATAVRWSMQGGAFVAGSIHHSPAQLRAAVKAP